MGTVVFFLFLLLSFSAATENVCSVESLLDGVYLMTQCPLRVPALEVDGDSLDVRSLEEGYTSVLFYAKWCPFSLQARATFDVLSTMFPHIRHLALEESSAQPSVFSRYGIHALPTFLLINRTSRTQYHGSKNIDALVEFYSKITGSDPELLPQLSSIEEYYDSFRTKDEPLKEWLVRKRYLILSILFLCYRTFVYIFPRAIHRLKSLWRVHGLVNLGGVFGNRGPLLEQAAHALNVKRLWSKLRVAKMRKFRKSARNARVWASSLTSVSLGESSSSSSTARTEAS